MVGAVVHIEPRIIGFERRRPDLDIISADRSLLIDVAVAHPAAPSRNSLTPLAAAASTEATKVGKYGVLAAARAATFLPFVMESFGAFGKEALKVLHILHKAAANATLPLLRTHVYQTLSVALQRGNSLIAKRGVDAKAAAWDRPRFSHGAAAAAAPVALADPP